MDLEIIIESLHTWGKGKESKPYGKKKDRSREYFSWVHQEISDLKRRVSYHAEFDIFPEDLITSAAPNEHKEEFTYRKDNYKQVTKPYWDKALSSTYRIWNPQNYHINWKDEERENYFNYEYPVYGSYVNFFKDVVHKMKYSDPNTVLAVKPKFIPGEVTEEGEFVPDQSEQVTPIAELYSADHVFDYKEGEYVLLLTKNNSVVNVGGAEKEEGLIFELFDQNDIYIIYQTGKKEEWTFEATLYYHHGWESLPAWKLKGIPVYHPNETLYYSHFMCSLPNLDQAAVFANTQFGVISKVSYPTRWYFTDDCGTCSGAGSISNYDDPGVQTTCTICKGTGKKFTFSWGKDFQIPYPTNLTDENTLPLGGGNAIGVLDPGTGAMEFLDKKVQTLLETSFINLQIDVANKPNGQTATESKIDREEFFSFLVQNSAEIFYLLEESLHAHSFMRWEGYENDKIEVVAPTEFQIRTSTDLTEEFKLAMEAKLPSPYLQKILLENLKQRFKGDSGMERVVEIVTKLDPLMTKTDMEVTSLVSNFFIAKWRAVLHHFIYQFIAESVAENPKFLEGEIYGEIKTALEGKAKAMAAETEVRTADAIMDQLARA